MSEWPFEHDAEIFVISPCIHERHEDVARTYVPYHDHIYGVDVLMLENWPCCIIKIILKCQCADLITKDYGKFVP